MSVLQFNTGPVLRACFNPLRIGLSQHFSRFEAKASAAEVVKLSAM